MAAKDLYDDNVRTALIKDGWTITDDPFSLKIGERDLFVDLGAEKLLIADRGQEKIAIEVKSFISPSPVKDLENALGQYILYANIMAREYPDRTLYLAIRDEIYYRASRKIRLSPRGLARKDGRLEAASLEESH